MARWSMGRRIALCAAMGLVAAAVVAIVVMWKVSLAVEERRCDAKSDAELLAMARRAAQSTAPDMGAAGIDPRPVAVRYDPAADARAKFVFRTVGAHPQTADVWISRNCHAGVGWLTIHPPLH